MSAGLRQVDVARRVGKPQSYVSKVETGFRPLRVEELPRLCKALGVTPLEFIQLLFGGY